MWAGSEAGSEADEISSIYDFFKIKYSASETFSCFKYNIRCKVD